MPWPKLKPMVYPPLPAPVFFRVCSDAGGMRRGKNYNVFEDAERAARQAVKSGRTTYTYIFGYDDGYTREPSVWMATVLRDACDKVWCEISYDGGRVTDAIERMLT